MTRRGFSTLCLMSVALAVCAADAATGALENLVFSQYAGPSSSAELLRRLVTPLNAWRLREHAAAGHIDITEQPVDLSRQRFAAYVPVHMPPQGYALLVFVPPWNEAKVPPGWAGVLERHGMILVTAAGIGNDANLLDRRDPVALLAATNMMARYRVDPSRVYIGGFSGGSRVALRLAVGYPDLFRGALLEAGSDALGDLVPLPPRALLEQFQTRSRVVYLTGQQDTANQEADRRSRSSLRDWCMENTDLRSIPWMGHDIAPPNALEGALASLEAPRPPGDAQPTACRLRIANELDKALEDVATLIEAGDSAAATKQLDALDHRYGGLAAPRSVELASRLQRAAAPSH